MDIDSLKLDKSWLKLESWRIMGAGSAWPNIVEHDPLLYKDFQLMVEYVAQHLKQTSREATILLYSPVWTFIWKR